MSSIRHLANIKIQDQYETPPELFRKACIEYNVSPLVDVCATIQNTKCDDYFNKAEDSLSKDWDFPFFMNPPYSRVFDFMKKAYYESKKWKVEGLILIYAKTDTKFWHSFIENKAEVHFIKGRIKFLRD